MVILVSARYARVESLVPYAPDPEGLRLYLRSLLPTDEVASFGFRRNFPEEPSYLSVDIFASLFLRGLAELSQRGPLWS